MQRSGRGLCIVLQIGMLCALPALARAELTDIDWLDDRPVLNGKQFGDAGAYRLRHGIARFAFDPKNRANAVVVDLDKAPRNVNGRVAALADIVVLHPAEPKKNPGISLLEVSNRGGKAALRYFNQGLRVTGLPAAEDDFGDGLLMRHGLTLIWVGWQFDVPVEAGRLRLRVPTARGPKGASIEGLVRSDWVPSEDTASLPLAHRNHIPYPVTNADDARNLLTVRDRREGPRQIIDRSRWRFARSVDGRNLASNTDVTLDGGFESGRIYELTYVAKDPAVAGLGLAVVRDAMSYVRYAPGSEFPTTTALAFGVSQTGRFLRHFLYQGFNVDEQGRRVFDAMLIHSAGAGRGSFNHRFAQPSRDGHQNSAFLYPTDLFPFAGRGTSDSNRDDGLLAAYDDPQYLPNIFYTNTGYEYWGRAGSLIHTTPDGSADLAPLDNERIYHLASAQHFEDLWPPDPAMQIPGANAWRGNPLPLLMHLRALMIRLIEWAHDDSPPPASRYPTVADGTLVPVEQLKFPVIPGIVQPAVSHRAYRLDYGDMFDAGIVTKQPPAMGPAYGNLVPQVDHVGNELGGLAAPAATVPLATYTPWSLYRGNPRRLADFRGMIIPLPMTKSASDDRPAIATLYPDRGVYLDRLAQAASKQMRDGYLLEEDLERVIRRGQALWEWVSAMGAESATKPADSSQ